MEISYGNFSQTYCGDEEDLFGDPGPFTNISTTMEVKFKTDSVNPRSGFLAVVCCDVNVTKVVMSCELNLTYTIYFSIEFLTLRRLQCKLTRLTENGCAQTT